jgi:hypothetical protein
LKATSRFGAELDSLTDFYCDFGLSGIQPNGLLHERVIQPPLRAKTSGQLFAT